MYFALSFIVTVKGLEKFEEVERGCDQKHLESTGRNNDLYDKQRLNILKICFFKFFFFTLDLVFKRFLRENNQGFFFWKKSYKNFIQVFFC